MDDTDAAQEGKTDGHLCFCDGIHRATQEGGLQDDVTSDSGLCDDVGRWKVNLSWEDQEIVVGEAALDLRVHELLDGEPI